MSKNTTPEKAKRGPNGETRKRPNDLEPWELNVGIPFPRQTVSIPFRRLQSRQRLEILSKG